MFGSLKSFSQASWEFAPSTPWQATMALSGKSAGVPATAFSICCVRGAFSPMSRFWLARLSSKMSE